MLPMLSPLPRRKLSEDEFYALGTGRARWLLCTIGWLLRHPHRLTETRPYPMLGGSSQSKERRRCA